MTAIGVFVLDDHDVVRENLRTKLRTADDIEVVGEAATAAQARSRIPALAPDVAILDVRLPDGDGITVCRDLRTTMDRPPAVLVLTPYAGDQAVIDAGLAGSAGYLPKQVPAPELVNAIRRLAAGETLLDREVTRRMIGRLSAVSDDDPRPAALNDREQRILGHLAEGLGNHEIAREMQLADKTIRNALPVLLRKLGIDRRATQAPAGQQRSRRRR